MNCPKCVTIKRVDCNDIYSQLNNTLLEIPDITGDLLFKYVLDYLKPTLDFGETPLEN